MVRVGKLAAREEAKPDARDNKSGRTPGEQRKAVCRAVLPLLKKRDRLYREIIRELRAHDLAFPSSFERSEKDDVSLNNDFKTFVEPRLVLSILCPDEPENRTTFPSFAGKTLYGAAFLQDKAGRRFLGVAAVPAGLPAVFPLPDAPGRYVRTEELVSSHMEELFPAYRIENRAVFAVTHRAPLCGEAKETEDSRNEIVRLLKTRADQKAVRLEIGGKRNTELETVLREMLGLSPEQVFYCRCPLLAESIFPAALHSRPTLTYPPFCPREPSWFLKDRPVKQQVRQKDRLIFYPFESMEPFLRLLKESASDPDVASIQITLYRLAPDSRVIRELCLAAENGKRVTVLVELRARFDEVNNLRWAEELSRAGCRVLYGPKYLKCHAKLCLITFRNRRKKRYITQTGTGNYNEETAALYTDLCLFTANRDIGRDAARFFRNMERPQNASYRQLLVSPRSLKPALLNLFDREIRKGERGLIRIKANALTERELIDKLSEASNAGVKIHLFLRSICCLRPGIPGKTANITVTGIVGRFLEHSRIYCFGPDEDCRLYLSSADLMGRNMSRRVEVACPVLDPDLKKNLLRLLTLLKNDNQKARLLMPDGTYRKIENGAPPVDSQEQLRNALTLQ